LRSMPADWLSLSAPLQLMRAIALCALCLGLLPPVSSKRTLQPASAMTPEMRPIRKVITLLEEMKVQAEKDASADQLAHEKYMCWCTTNRKEKTAAVEIAEERISALTTFLEEASAKEGSLKTEIAGLADDIANDLDAVDTAMGLRDSERKEFLAAEADMKETRSLLAQAIKVLEKVQLLQKKGQSTDLDAHKAQVTLVQLRDSLQQRFPNFGERMQRDLFDVLGSLPSAEDGALLRGLHGASFQQALADQPKGLVGQAAGAKSYNSRSGSILGILGEMHDEFTRDLFDAQRQDFMAEVAFQQLRAAKLAEIAVASSQKAQKEAALADLLDKAAKATSEKEAMEEALAADQAFLLTLEKNCKEEDEEYKQRLAVRTEEIRALSEALKILTDDDGRDLYAKTMSFAQMHAASAAQDRAMERARQRIQAAARRHKSWALASLAVHMGLDAFTKVKEVMDKMLAELQKQQKEEYAKWEWCKKEIDHTEDSIKEGENLKEDLAEKHLALSNEIQTLTAEIADLTKDIADMEVSLKQAGEERKAQNGLFQTSISDQRATVNILKKAEARLQAFYSLVQGQQEPGAAAPPPPPSPKDYLKQGGAGGVLQLLAKIINDAEVAEQEMALSEQKSQADYAEIVKQASASLEADRSSVRQREARIAAAEGEKSETEEAQLANDEDLAKLQDLLKAHHLECDYILKYFDIRQQARQEEMDAITDAKAILSGADFRE